jgi:pre-mRNA-splicing factor RBM22/SLT11
LKNVCQTCLLDLEFGLPVQVRDSVNPQAEKMPTSEAGREYYMDLATKRVENEDLYGKFEPSAMIQKLARTTPYYKRNRAHICSFFVKGECKRGAECPYRHEMPETGDLSVQNIKDRYHGTNDPVANKMLKKAETFAKITAPEDTDISTLYIGGVDPLKISEEDLRDAMYSYGEIRSVKISAPQNCAFVAYTTREAAEKAAEALFNKMYIKGCFLRVSWGKPASLQQPYGALTDTDQSTFFSLPAGSELPPPSAAHQPPAPGMGAQPYYPSMDPSQRGAKPNKPE